MQLSFARYDSRALLFPVTVPIVFTMSYGKRGRGELDSYPSCSHYTARYNAHTARYNAQTALASGSAPVPKSRLLNLLDAHEEDEKPKVKRARKEKDPSKPPPEKRAARFKKACPQSILDRVERVLTQR